MRSEADSEPSVDLKAGLQLDGFEPALLLLVTDMECLADQLVDDIEEARDIVHHRLNPSTQADALAEPERVARVPVCRACIRFGHIQVGQQKNSLWLLFNEADPTDLHPRRDEGAERLVFPVIVGIFEPNPPPVLCHGLHDRSGAGGRWRDLGARQDREGKVASRLPSCSKQDGREPAFVELEFAVVE